MNTGSGERLSKSVPYPMLINMSEETTLSQDKKPSPDLIKLIIEAGDLMQKYERVEKQGKDVVKKIKAKAKLEGFGIFEVNLICREVLHDKFSPSQLNYWFPLPKNNVLVENTNRNNDDNSDTEQDDDDGYLNSDDKHKEPVNIDPIVTEEEPTQDELAEITQSIEKEKPKPFNAEECFKSLPDDNAVTCWKMDKISGNALKNRISSWQGNTQKFFRVWMQEVNA